MVVLRAFFNDRRGAIVVPFAISSVVIIGLAFGAISFAQANTQRAHIQDALDGAALHAVRLFTVTTATDGEIEAAARSSLQAKAVDYPGLVNTAVLVDRANMKVDLRYKAIAADVLGTPIWNGVFNLDVKSTAGLGGAEYYPVCILITEPFDNHTLRASNGSKLDLNHCLVQVNTANWDAVEAKPQSYIHINDGQNCYVGDIHFGDVVPAKMPTCDLFPNPFKTMTVPASSCTYNDFEVSKKKPHSAPLNPGTYCGGLDIQQDVTFNPGLYIIKDGPLSITGILTDVEAEGVTFLLTGDDAGLEIDSTGTMTFSPAAAGAAGKFDGFVFFLDEGVNSNPSATNLIEGATVTMSGTLYFGGQHFVMGNKANVTVTHGSLVTGWLLGQGGNLNFTGSDQPQTAAEQALRKAVEHSIPVLIH